jgi:hypothetical protein
MAHVANKVRIEQSSYNERWYLIVTTTDGHEFQFLVRRYWLKLLLHILLTQIEGIEEDE